MNTANNSITIDQSIVMAVNCLAKPSRNRLLVATINYILYGEQPTFINKAEKAVWILIAELCEVKGHNRPCPEPPAESTKPQPAPKPKPSPAPTIDDRKRELQAQLNDRTKFEQLKSLFPNSPSHLRRTCNAIIHQWTTTAEPDWSWQHLVQELKRRYN